MAATVVIAAMACAGSAACQAQDLLKPDETFLFAERDSINLYMDVYYPADGSEMTVDGVNKPTILYVFGGGFKVGRRDTPTAREWFRLLTDEGFTVAAIDYRLGLKGVEGMGSINDMYNAIQIAVEDLFSATKYILDNAEEVDIDPSSLVIAGSSAGAITVLQAEWELCNRMGSSVMLPKDFHYAGVMSFAGAIYSRQGTVRYHSEPAPHLLFHGTADRIVTYRQIHLLNHAFQGTKVLARSDEPIMEPIADYEKTGFFGNVVFTNGYYMKDADTIRMFYGASDEVICSAEMSVKEILNTLR